MKTLVLASLLTLVAATALGAEKAVSSNTLQGMGLEKMQNLSDRDGNAIRGKGPFDNRFFTMPTPLAPNQNLGPTFGSFTGFGLNPPTPPGGNNNPPSGNNNPPTTPPGGIDFGSFFPNLGNFNFGGINP
jgi:hypothetical protein